MNALKTKIYKKAEIKYIWSNWEASFFDKCQNEENNRSCISLNAEHVLQRADEDDDDWINYIEKKYRLSLI